MKEWRKAEIKEKGKSKKYESINKKLKKEKSNIRLKGK